MGRGGSIEEERGEKGQGGTISSYFRENSDERTLNIQTKS